jgi:HSP20 family molecular chaperone IbpA
MREDASKLYISADVPGITADQLSLEVDDEKRLLTISYSKNENKESKDEAGKVYRTERYSGSFSRQIALPKTANLQNASTSLENGVLQIEFPLTEKKLNVPRKLSINSQAEAIADAPVNTDRKTKKTKAKKAETDDAEDVIMNIDEKQSP